MMRVEQPKGPPTPTRTGVFVGTGRRKLPKGRGGPWRKIGTDHTPNSSLPLFHSQTSSFHLHTRPSTMAATFVNGKPRLRMDNQGTVTEFTVETGGVALPESLLEENSISLLHWDGDEREKQMVPTTFKLCDIPENYMYLYFEVPGDGRLIYFIFLHGLQRSQVQIRDDSGKWMSNGTKHLDDTTTLRDLGIGPGMVVHTGASPRPLDNLTKQLKATQDAKATVTFCPHLSNGRPNAVLHVSKDGRYDMVLAATAAEALYHWFPDHGGSIVSSSEFEWPEGQKHTSPVRAGCRDNVICKQLCKASLALEYKTEQDLMASPECLDVLYLLHFYLKPTSSGLGNLKEALQLAHQEDARAYADKITVPVKVCPTIGTFGQTPVSLTICRGIAVFDSVRRPWNQKYVLVAWYVLDDAWHGMVYNVRAEDNMVDMWPSLMHRIEKGDRRTGTFFKTEMPGMVRMPVFLVSALMNNGKPVHFTLEHMEGPEWGASRTDEPNTSRTAAVSYRVTEAWHGKAIRTGAQVRTWSPTPPRLGTLCPLPNDSSSTTLAPSTPGRLLRSAPS